MVTNREDVGIAIRSAFLKKGTQQKFSLIFLIIISIIFLYIDTFQSKPLNFLRSITKDVIYRGSLAVSLPGKGFKISFQSLERHFNVREENLRLKEENIKLKDSLYGIEFLKVENKQLKKLLDQEKKSTSLLMNTKVIIDKNSPFLKSIIVDKGAREKIKKGMAVLDGNNFIGRVVEVNFFSSRVLLVTDLNSKIPVVVEPKAYQAILSGTGKESPVLEYLPKNHEIENGSKVYTSGKDGVFLSGIPIGETKKEKNTIIISLYSDFSQLSYVNINLGEQYLDFK